jgi:hypothetical protein
MQAAQRQEGDGEPMQPNPSSAQHKLLQLLPGFVSGRSCSCYNQL